MTQLFLEWLECPDLPWLLVLDVHVMTGVEGWRLPGWRYPGRCSRNWRCHGACNSPSSCSGQTPELHIPASPSCRQTRNHWQFQKSRPDRAGRFDQVRILLTHLLVAPRLAHLHYVAALMPRRRVQVPVYHGFCLPPGADGARLVWIDIVR